MNLHTQVDREPVARLVRDVITSILPNVRAEDISGAKSLSEHGADSVDRIEIVLGIMKRLGIDEPMSNLSNISNIDELVDYVCRAGRAQRT